MEMKYKINKHTTRQIFKSVGERMSMQHLVQHKIHNICTFVNINTYNFSLISLML